MRTKSKRRNEPWWMGCGGARLGLALFSGWALLIYSGAEALIA